MASEDYKKLVKNYRQLAKQADTRLLRLEKLSEQEAYKNVKEYAYKRAVKDITKWDKEKGSTKNIKAPGYVPRFNTKPPEGIQQLEAKIADIQHFLSAPTSTKFQLESKYGKMAETVNQRYNTDFTWEDLVNYYETKQSENNAARYGSKTIIKAIAIIKKIGPDPEAIREAKRKNVKLTDDKEVDNLVKILLKKGQTSIKLFKD